jgi:hypothetical protein
MLAVDLLAWTQHLLDGELACAEPKTLRRASVLEVRAEAASKSRMYRRVGVRSAVDREPVIHPQSSAATSRSVVPIRAAHH